MKLTNKTDENMETQTGPKLRNINEEKAEQEEKKPEGADIRLKVFAIIILALAIFVGVKGVFTKISLSSQIEKQQKLLTKTEKDASKYGITKDKDGNLVTPDIETDSVSGSAVEESDAAVLDSFAKLLLNWEGQSGYNKVRQTLIDEWGFSKDCKLLTSFMPETTEKLNANLFLSKYDTFVISEGEEGNAYFLICTVRNSINGTSASGTVGLQIKINKEGNITNVTAQTLS